MPLASRPAHYTVLHDRNTDQGSEWYVQGINEYSPVGLKYLSFTGCKNFLSRCVTAMLVQLDLFQSQHLCIVSLSVSSIHLRVHVNKFFVDADVSEDNDIIAPPQLQPFI